jgi:GTP-binding protein
MKKNLVAIVGRPNVGKSTFFNRIVGKKISIVKDLPGVTRDRIYADAEWCGKEFTLIDTGGLDFSDADFAKNIRMQVEAAIELAEVIIFLTDGKDGVTTADHEIATILRNSRKKVVLAVNKLDNFELEKTYEFYELGFGEPLGVSSEQAKGLGEVLDEVTMEFESGEDEESEAIKIAIIGRPNVGKSSIVNKILGFERVIVSDVAGTTRDAIDTPFVCEGKQYVLIDTAGIRRNRSVEFDSVESYSVLRAMSALRRCDVALIVINAEEGFSAQDARIAGLVHEEGRPSIVVMNKWDLVEKDTHTIVKFENQLKTDLAFMSYFKSLFVSAKTGKRLDKLFPLVDEVYENASKRISTGLLNEFLREAVSASEPPAFSGRRLKLFYATQPSSNPPKFVFFVNDIKLLHFSYERYLENSMRRSFDFSGTPIKLEFVGRKEE